MQNKVKRLAPDATPEERKALNRMAREQTKEKLLKDITFDLMICELEGWDKLEYLKELRDLINSFFKVQHVEKNQ